MYCAWLTDTKRIQREFFDIGICQVEVYEVALLTVLFRKLAFEGGDSSDFSAVIAALVGATTFRT